MYNALHSCVVSMNTHEYLRSAVQTYLFTFASTSFMSTLRWALKNFHAWQIPCAQLHVKHFHELCEISFLRPDRQSAINSVFCVLTAVCDNKGHTCGCVKCGMLLKVFVWGDFLLWRCVLLITTTKKKLRTLFENVLDIPELICKRQLNRDTLWMTSAS